MISEILKDINWLAILVGSIGYFMLGAIWYSFLFKDQWIRYSGVNMDDPKLKEGVAATMISSFVMMFITSIGLAVFTEYLGLTGWMYGVKLGLLTGICFASTSMAINMLYEKKPIQLFFINAGYQVLGIIIAAVIICSWR